MWRPPPPTAQDRRPPGSSRRRRTPASTSPISRDHRAQIVRRRQLDREDAVPARGAPQRPPVRPARRHPDGDAAVHRPRLELAVPVGREPLQPVVEQPRALARRPSSPNRAGSNSPVVSLPIPTPSTSRPPLSRSSVTVSRASWCGRRRGTGVTSGPMITRSVTIATAASTTHGSASARTGVLVGDVVPHEEPVPPARLGPLRQLGDEPRLGQLPERGDENGSLQANLRGHACERARRGARAGLSPAQLAAMCDPVSSTA